MAPIRDFMKTQGWIAAVQESAQAKVETPQEESGLQDALRPCDKTSQVGVHRRRHTRPRGPKRSPHASTASRALSTPAKPEAELAALHEHAAALTAEQQVELEDATSKQQLEFKEAALKQQEAALKQQEAALKQQEAALKQQLELKEATLKQQQQSLEEGRIMAKQEKLNLETILAEISAKLKAFKKYKGSEGGRGTSTLKQRRRSANVEMEGSSVSLPHPMNADFHPRPQTPYPQVSVPPVVQPEFNYNVQVNGGAAWYVPGSSHYPTGFGADPFTGCDRYRPGPSTNTGAPVAVAEPFTGGGAYSSADLGQNQTNIYFPKTDGVTFEQANAPQIIAKLKELNDGAPQEHKFSGDILESLERLLLSVCGPISSKQRLTIQQISLLWKACHWPEDIVFPVLDIMRLAVRHPQVNKSLCGGAEGLQLCNHLLSLMRPEGRPANQMLALRTLCNCFSGRRGRALLMAQRETVLSRAADLAPVCNNNNNNHIHIALASLVLNYAGCLHSQPDLEAKAQCLSVASRALESAQDQETVFRLLVALGTTVASDQTAKHLACSLGINSQISMYLSISDPSKVGECCKLVLMELQ